MTKGVWHSEKLGEKLVVVGYLPMDCPNCKRRRLEYAQNELGAIINVTCEKCEIDFTNLDD